MNKTNHRRRNKNVDYENIYLKLIQIFAEQENVKVEINMARRV